MRLHNDIRVGDLVRVRGDWLATNGFYGYVDAIANPTLEIRLYTVRFSENERIEFHSGSVVLATRYEPGDKVVIRGQLRTVTGINWRGPRDEPMVRLDNDAAEYPEALDVVIGSASAVAA